MTKTVRPCRLAMRHEGSMWNAYLAKPTTMEGATIIGSIAMVAVVGNQERREAFLRMMTEVMSERIEELFGIKPDITIGPAPEHEKGGNA